MLHNQRIFIWYKHCSVFKFFTYWSYSEINASVVYMTLHTHTRTYTRTLLHSCVPWYYFHSKLNCEIFSMSMVLTDIIFVASQCSIKWSLQYNCINFLASVSTCHSLKYIVSLVFWSLFCLQFHIPDIIW